MPELVIFDLDGTLVPTMHGFADIAAAVIAERWGWSTDRARRGYLATSGAPFFQQLEMLFPGDPRNAEAAAEFERRKEGFFHGVTMAPSTRSALWRLRRRGLRLAVSSNNWERLVTSMIRREAPGLFHEVCGYREGFTKGDQHFAHLLRRFGLSSDAGLFVGDSLSDLRRAAEAGLRFVGVTGTEPSESFRALDARFPTIDAVSELPQLLQRIGEPPSASAAIV